MKGIIFITLFFLLLSLFSCGESRYTIDGELKEGFCIIPSDCDDDREAQKRNGDTNCNDGKCSYNYCDPKNNKNGKNKSCYDGEICVNDKCQLKGD